MHATYVGEHSLHLLNIDSMRECILERNHTNVICVGKASVLSLAWENTLERDHMIVICLGEPLLTDLTLWNTIQLTLERNHTNAPAALFPLTQHENAHWRETLWTLSVVLFPLAWESTHWREIVWMSYVCGKDFSSSFSLRWHEGTHTEEKLYGSHLCGKIFSRLHVLRLHEQTQRVINIFSNMFWPKLT